MAKGPQPQLNPPGTNDNYGVTDDEEEEEEDEDDPELSPGASKKTKAAKKTTLGPDLAKEDRRTAAQIRKEQNRSSQREFRQRKQQYIRALEARVELYSTGHDAQVDRLRWILRPLLSENAFLRNMVSELSHFIGKRNIGGYLTEAGLSKKDLAEAMGASSDKTMTEAWFSWPHATECEELKRLRKENKIPLDGLPDCKVTDLFGDTSDNNKSGGKGQAANADGKKRQMEPDSPGKGSKRGRQAPPVHRAPTGGTNLGGNNLGLENLEQSGATPFLGVASSALPSPNNSWQHAAGQTPRSNADTYFSNAVYGGGLPRPAEVMHNTMMYGATLAEASMFPMGDINFDSTYASGPGTSSATLAAAKTNGLDLDAAAALMNQAYSVTSDPLEASTARSVQSDGTNGPGDNTFSLTAKRADVIRSIHRRLGRVVTLVNRIRKSRGAVKFLAVPVNITLTEFDHRLIDNEAALSPQMKLASMSLPYGWDEGEISPHKSDYETQFSSPERETVKDFDRLLEGFSQLEYHMINYRMNPSYKLPPTLMPTALQRSTQHDSIIGAIPWGSVRDKLIQHTYHKYDSVILDILRFIKLHEGDVDLESSWELSYPFLIRYPDLIDDSLLVEINRARNGRGQSALTIELLWIEHRRFKAFAQAKLKEVFETQ